MYGTDDGYGVSRFDGAGRCDVRELSASYEYGKAAQSPTGVDRQLRDKVLDDDCARTGGYDRVRQDDGMMTGAVTAGATRRYGCGFTGPGRYSRMMTR